MTMVSRNRFGSSKYDLYSMLVSTGLMSNIFSWCFISFLFFSKQSELKKKLIVGDEVGWDPKSIRLIGGVDVSFPKNDTVHACPCLVVLSYSEDGKHIEVL